MSSYFDRWDREVRDAAMDHPRDFEFLEAVIAIEQSRVREISLVTGDREFPDALRERIQGAIAVHAVSIQMPDQCEKARSYTRSTRASALSGQLHSLFHEVAGARIETRFGLLNDDPAYMLVLRDEYEEERARAADADARGSE